jgi:hypothetical protein
MGFIVQIEISLYNADVIAVCANKIGALQISNRHGALQIPNLSNFTQLVDGQVLTSVLVTTRHTGNSCASQGELDASSSPPLEGPGEAYRHLFNFRKLYESDFTFSPIIFPYNADVIAVWANEIGPLEICNR